MDSRRVFCIEYLQHTDIIASLQIREIVHRPNILIREEYSTHHSWLADLIKVPSRPQ